MSKQTAVDWLFNQMSNVAAGYVTEMNSEEILTHAKHMEKWQIKGAYQKGRFSGQTNWGYGNDVTAEQYYNETYGDK